ncbi:MULTISPECIES: glycosyltransferase [Bradyrhizobium]|uniref:glycosyltransferase n=1 Tax=Bradyrhizobium brasilense TaxID=1419277 RepID=UPI001F1D5ED1|nr:glycosyltransferase [Bradyrhizobium brasilense]
MPATGVLFVISSLSVGGTERHLLSISRALRARGWKVAVCCTGGEGPLADDFRAAGVKVFAAPSARLPAFRRLRPALAAVHLMSVLVKERVALIHFFLPEAYLIGAPLALLAGIKLRIMSRRSLNAYQRKYMVAGFLERRWHSLMAAVLANSRAVLRELELEGARPERLGLIYNGLDVGVQARRSRDAIRAELGLKHDALVFIIVANLIQYKGHLDLIEAFARAADRLPQGWRLLVVGRDDGAGPATKALAASHGIADSILFLGARSDVPDLLNASDIGLLSSHEEGFSNAIIEGMRARLPMIVTAVGGNAEAVINGETGVVVPPRDPAALADAIAELSSDSQRRRNYGDSGRRRMEQNFALGSCVAAYEATYRGLLAGKSPSEITEIHRP